MRQIISHKRGFYGYLVYGLILSFLILYYRFPSDAFRSYLQSSAERISSGMRVSIGDVHPMFSPGLKLIQTGVSLVEMPDVTVFSADSILIRSSVWSLLRGKLAISFRCLAYDGDISGYAVLKQHEPEAPLETSIEIKDVQLDAFPSPALFGRDVKGVVGGTVVYGGHYNSFIDGEGKALLHISNGRIELLSPILGLKYIEYNKLTVALTLNNRTIDLGSVEYEGKDIQGTLSGKIRLREDLIKSGLKLKGTIEPLSGFISKSMANPLAVSLIKQHQRKGKLSFSIKGTLENPKIDFN